MTKWNSWKWNMPNSLQMEEDADDGSRIAQWCQKQTNHVPPPLPPNWWDCCSIHCCPEPDHWAASFPYPPLSMEGFDPNKRDEKKNKWNVRSKCEEKRMMEAEHSQRCPRMTSHVLLPLPPHWWNCCSIHCCPEPDHWATSSPHPPLSLEGFDPNQRDGNKKKTNENVSLLCVEKRWWQQNLSICQKQANHIPPPSPLP